MNTFLKRSSFFRVMASIIIPCTYIVLYNLQALLLTLSHLYSGAFHGKDINLLGFRKKYFKKRVGISICQNPFISIKLAYVKNIALLKNL